MAVYFDLNMYTPTKRSQSFDIDSIYQALSILMNTRPGQILFKPEFGVALEDELFEFVDTATSLNIFAMVTDAITRFEPRVIIDSARTQVTPYPDDNLFDLELYFSIPSLSDTTFEFVGSFTPQGV